MLPLTEHQPSFAHVSPGEDICLAIVCNLRTPVKSLAMPGTIGADERIVLLAHWAVGVAVASRVVRMLRVWRQSMIAVIQLIQLVQLIQY